MLSNVIKVVACTKMPTTSLLKSMQERIRADKEEIRQLHIAIKNADREFEENKALVRTDQIVRIFLCVILLVF